MAFVRWSKDALRDLEKLDNAIGRRIVEKVIWLESHFSNTMPEKLHGELKDWYKLRVGDYRALYSMRGDEITIEAVGHRRDIYT